ncbi:MAG: type II toxin-antitoxin system RelE/ParE family toxin [Verrucomicrobiia bacterium]
MRYRFLSPAQRDLAHAMEYYERASPGLGLEFADEVERTVQRIVLNPEAWTKVSAHSRRCRMRRFPYGVFYSIHGEEILILGVMDLRCHPDSWRARIEGC